MIPGSFVKQGYVAPQPASIIFILDEPFSALDYQTGLSVEDDIGKIIKK